jgi:hypothetical protein
VNEELQSTNEELEASKEELQSMNEELHTVNNELGIKIEALDTANSDLRNLFDSTQIATVFLDHKLTIRSFTPAMSKIFHILPTDQRAAHHRSRKPPRHLGPAAGHRERARHSGSEFWNAKSAT